MSPTSLSLAVTVDQFGGPDVMQLRNVALQPPAADEVTIRQSVIGFNYIDVYQRSGVYPLPLPTGLGHEAAGVIEAIGSNVSHFNVGDRVAYMGAGVGAYCSARNVAERHLVKIPDDITDQQATSLLFKGMTAQYLLRKTHPVQPGEMIIVHAAAGGVGQILSSWAKSLGAFVVGTAGSDSKCQTALDAGCDIAINYSDPDWVNALLSATGGRKARVVYDSVGQHTFLGSLDLTAPFGLVVSYGAASGAAPAITMDLLNKKGCLFVTRPSVFAHIADSSAFRTAAAEVFSAISRQIIKSKIGAVFPLDRIADAHRAAEARTVSGSIVITVTD